MGVGRPGAFVNLGNRFPVHYQALTAHSNDRFVANFDRNLIIHPQWGLTFQFRSNSQPS
jgi:hypothetical protein